MKERTYQTPLEDLRKDALQHYEEAATKIHCSKVEYHKRLISIGIIDK